MKYINDYGMLVTVTSENDVFLFIDGIDRDRYISELIKNTNSIPENDTCILIAGLNSNSATIVFDGGCEEKLRYVMRRVHLSYSAYRRNKKCPVRFNSSDFQLIDGSSALRDIVKNIKEKSDFICTKFGKSSLK